MIGNADLATRIEGAISQTGGLYSRLVLVVAPPGSGKTRALHEVAEQMGAPYVNLGLELSKRLIGLTERQRVLAVPKALDDLVGDGAQERGVVLLDNIELLFDTADLKQDPLRLLQAWARRRTVVAAWPGAIEGDYLTYAEPGHPEYQRYQIGDLLIVGG